MLSAARLMTTYMLVKISDTLLIDRMKMEIKEKHIDSLVLWLNHFTLQSCHLQLIIEYLGWKKYHALTCNSEILLGYHAPTL